jgi:hypothetical protein
VIPIEVHSKSRSIDGEVAPFAEARLKFALDRLRDLRRILISVEDVNGPKGGPDKHCRVVAEFAFSTVVAQETQPTWQAAVARAVHRISRNAVRELQRVNGAAARRGRRPHRIPGRGEGARANHSN